MPFLNFVLTTYIGLLVARLFVPMGGELYFNPLLRAIVRVTEPVVRLVRMRVFITRSGLDLSPLVVALLFLIGRGLVLGLANGLKMGSALYQSMAVLLDLLYGCWGVLLLGLVFISLGGAFANGPAARIIMAVTDPVLRPLRRLAGYRERGLDWAPLFGLVVLVAVRTAIIVAVFRLFGPDGEVLSISRVALVSSLLLLNTLVTFLMVMMIARAVVSWMNMDPYNPLVQTLILFTDPILTPIRRIIPVWSAGLDFSPMFGMILLMAIRHVINRIT